MDRVVPRSRFGSSIFSTPLLLVFRLFYQATYFDSSRIPSAIRSPRVVFGNLGSLLPWRSSEDKSREGIKTPFPGKSTEILQLASKISADQWHRFVSNGRYPLAKTSRLVSMTWVKSLSAPLSHEYLQFIAEDEDSGEHYRLVTERDTDGDWVYIIASSPHKKTSSTCSITQHRPYDYQHDLPLPLLSASWADSMKSERPTINDLASTLQDISGRSRSYNIMREHCWWYAEAVFERMVANTVSAPDNPITGPVMKHWPWSAYRYSYIVLGKRYLRRDVLIRQAKAFKQEMNIGGLLKW